MLLFWACNIAPAISIHALLAESDRKCQIIPIIQKNFYPRSPCGERRGACGRLLAPSWISIHALLAESDWVWTGGLSCDRYFYPRSPCGERLNSAYGALDGASISIHALLAESDVSLMFYDTSSLIFLSTLSLRRATLVNKLFEYIRADFYPRSPCGERHNINSSVNTADQISIHALLAESDIVHALKLADLMLFLSTLSLRRATGSARGISSSRAISIHALLAESDHLLII